MTLPVILHGIVFQEEGARNLLDGDRESPERRLLHLPHHHSRHSPRLKTVTTNQDSHQDARQSPMFKTVTKTQDSHHDSRQSPRRKTVTTTHASHHDSRQSPRLKTVTKIQASHHDSRHSPHSHQDSRQPPRLKRVTKTQDSQESPVRRLLHLPQPPTPSQTQDILEQSHPRACMPVNPISCSNTTQTQDSHRQHTRALKTVGALLAAPAQSQASQ